MKDYYRRKLPHWIPPEATFFVTFRLVHSLPTKVLKELEAVRKRSRQRIYRQYRGQKQKDKLYELEKQYFTHFDAWLDRCIEESPRWLMENSIASIVAEEIHRLEKKRYELIAYCIMPNHVHLLVNTAGFPFAPSHQGKTASYPLTDTLRLIKGRTARRCNQILGRQGKFWQPESYDHVIRNENEQEKTLAYILHNPVKAGLVDDWERWPFSYMTEKL
ncbi:MAG: hypothetical protein D6805_02280 [Planctomycetota bacterium]|nr:MAG: hypothetical protein D6805_02280 [Planctomycetota bacterium]